MATGRIPGGGGSPLTAKGDLYGYSTTQARVPVGNDGETLVANSSTSTGLSYQANFAAGKNKIVNGDFGVWQRGTSSGTNGIQTADRWFCVVSGTTTWSQDTSVPTGLVSQYSLKYTTGASTSYGQLFQALESAVVKPLRGQSMTFSIYLRTTGTAFTGTLALKAYYSNSTDAYGSQTTAVTITGGQSITPTSTWTRYSGTLTIPSDAVGIKIGVEPSDVQASGVVVYHAGVQLEPGSTATAFQTATGTIQGELAACQRYYWRNTPNGGNAYLSSMGTAATTSIADMIIALPVPMRVIPTVLETSTIRLLDGSNAFSTGTWTINSSDSSYTYPIIRYTHGSAALTQFRPYFIAANSSTSAYIALGAEL